MKKIIFYLLAILSLSPIYSCGLDCSKSKVSELIPYHKGDKWGYCLPVKPGDKNKEITIDAKYDFANPFSEGLALVELNSKYGFIDETGTEIIPLKYDFAYPFSEGLAMVNIGGKPDEKDRIEGGKWGYVNKEGKEVVLVKYDYAGHFHEGLALVSTEGRCGFVNKEGIEVIPLTNRFYDDFHEGLARVLSGNSILGFIDKEGKIVSIDEKYSRISKFQDGRASVAVYNGNLIKMGYIDKTGREIIPLKYEEAWDFSEGFAMVRLNNKYGYVDTAGNEVIQLKYKFVRDFSEGLAGVKLNNKWGFIDKSGNEVILLEYYNYGGIFKEGLASVFVLNENSIKYGFIDKSGREVVPLKYDEVKEFSEGIASVKLNGKYGFVDIEGKEIISIKYDNAFDFREGIAIVNFGDKFGYIDKNGTEYWED